MTPLLSACLAGLGESHPPVLGPTLGVCSRSIISVGLRKEELEATLN